MATVHVDTRGAHPKHSNLEHSHRLPKKLGPRPRGWVQLPPPPTRGHLGPRAAALTKVSLAAPRPPAPVPGSASAPCTTAARTTRLAAGAAGTRNVAGHVINRDAAPRPGPLAPRAADIQLPPARGRGAVFRRFLETEPRLVFQRTGSSRERADSKQSLGPAGCLVMRGTSDQPALAGPPPPQRPRGPAGPTPAPLHDALGQERGQAPRGLLLLVDGQSRRSKVASSSSDAPRGRQQKRPAVAPRQVPLDGECPDL